MDTVVNFDDNLSKFLKGLKAFKENNPSGTQYDASENSVVLRRAQVMKVLEDIGLEWSYIQNVVSSDYVYKSGRGIYDFTKLVEKFDSVLSEQLRVEEEKAEEALRTKIESETIRKPFTGKIDDTLIPASDSTYVEWGNTEYVHKVIASRKWFPVYIQGESGNGKTQQVIEACAKEGRELFRVQINPETDEDDLVGGFRLVDGDTVFEKGPVIRAMERGAICLLDEIDRGTNKLMCLQGIMEGKNYLIKKTGEVIEPRDGFNVIATANTKGKGDATGKYASSILDEAFLERFPITILQEYPTKSVERRIVRNNMIRHQCLDDEFAEHLVEWAKQLRDSFIAGASEDMITTRRLCQAVQTFGVFQNRDLTINFITSRFDEETREAFMQVYHAIDPSKLMREEALSEKKSN